MKNKQKFREKMTDAEYKWLMLTCENQSVIRKLTRAVGSYIAPTISYNEIQDEFLSSGGLCAEALNYLREIKRDLDDEAKTKILQATDEVMNSEEMAELAKQQAVIDASRDAYQWAIDNDIIKYVEEHQQEIDQDMNESMNHCLEL